jgi:hypothetical protein
MLLNLLLAAALAAEPLPNPYRDIPQDRNAWPLLLDACKLVVNGHVNDDYPSWRDPLRPAVRAHLAANAPALVKLDEALARSEMARPTSEIQAWNTGADFSTDAKLRELARLKVQRAYARSATGDRLGALRDLDDLLTLVDRLAEATGTSIDYLVTGAIAAIAFRGAQVLLGPPPAGFDLSRDDPTASLRLEAYSPAERAAWLALARHAADESRSLSSLRLGFGGDLVGSGAWFADPQVRAKAPGPAPTPEQVARHLAWRRQLLTDLAEEAAKPSSQRCFLRFERLREPVPPGLGDDWRQALGTDAHSFVWIARHVDRERADRRLTATAIALRLYAADHGNLPADLSFLVMAGRLPAVPLDPTTDRPLRYAPGEGLLYACDDDGVDHGGRRPWDRTTQLWFLTRDLPPLWTQGWFDRDWIPTTCPVTLG